MGGVTRHDMEVLGVQRQVKEQLKRIAESLELANLLKEIELQRASRRPDIARMMALQEKVEELQ